MRVTAVAEAAAAIQQSLSNVINYAIRLQGNPYGLKEATGMGMTADMGTAWGTAALQPAATGYYPYDPTLAAYG